ncbi:hypothetical protein KKA13_00745 [Patescibacteria group bacterium]|nr:hypothetical protein [Patescibacteria group bacterium]MBU1613347.1 hypothetical protein [Patescibacteria group bacterium]
MNLKEFFKKFKNKESKPAPKPEVVVEKKEVKPEIKDHSPAALRELLEKNLKWSQIIYEQNRQISRKLFWASIVGWVRLAVIVVPVIIAIIFLLPVARDIWGKYQSVMGSVSQTSQNINNTTDQLIKLLPVDQDKQQQLRELLK